jgi:hypothetical protein
VEVPKGEPSFWSGDVHSLETVLYGPNGSRLGTAKELLERAKSAPAVMEDFMRRAPRSGDEAPLEFTIRLPQGSYWLDREDNRHRIVSLRLLGIGRLVKDEIPLRPVRYRDKVLLSGSADVGGSRHVVSAVHPSDTRFSLGVSLAPGTEPVVLELEVSPKDVEEEK